MNRARNITDKDIRAVVEILDGWKGKLTWEALLEAIEKRHHVRYTRQALHNHARVKDAFTQRKDILANRPASERKAARSPELTMAQERNDRLAGENVRLTAENSRLLEQFARWAYNAGTRGLSPEFLNQPLPPVDRDTTRLGPRGGKAAIKKG